MKDSDDAAPPEALPERPQSPHPNYVTPAGLERLQILATDLAARRHQLGPAADPHELALLQRVRERAGGGAVFALDGARTLERKEREKRKEGGRRACKKKLERERGRERERCRERA